MGLLSKVAGAATSLLGGAVSDKANRKFQKQFAKNAVQWKVADAKKAGIHPLYALGAPTMSPSASVGATGQALADMGQDISRSFEATGDQEERVMSKQLASLQLERAGLENEELRTRIARLKSAQVGPAMPGAGVSDFQQRVVLPDGTVLPANPGVSSAQAVEDRSGEGADIIYGADLGLEYLKRSNVPIIRDTRLELERIVRNLNIARDFLYKPSKWFPNRKPRKIVGRRYSGKGR